MRTNLSIAMVLMTDKNSTDTYEVYDWSSEQRGILFSAFFWGYLIMNLCAAVLVNKFNNRNLLLCSATYSSIATIATPFIVKIGGYGAFVALRASLGLMQGFMMPVTSGQLSRWVPPNERARCGTLVLGGMHFGTIISFVSSGVLGTSAGGWPSIFYLSGGMSLLWCVVWYEWGAESPSSCSYISREEKRYIESALVHTSKAKKRTIPWAKIFTNKACYAVTIAITGHNWGYWILITQMPTFFDSVLNYSSSNNGLISAMPFACLWVVSFPISYIADMLIKKGVTSISLSRKLCNTIGHWGIAACLLALGYTNSSSVAIIMYTIGVTLVGFTFMGFNINHLDICPNFAGFLMGLTNGISNISAILGPLFVGYVVTDVTNADLWRIVFYVSAGVFFVGNLVFIIFGSGEIQDFNKVSDKEERYESKDIEKN
ncbi:putative inorganic phosphate cotransporter isoform X2 [Cimex lectularius]|nr:putative inorganic phosphate cotransporter isoform X2 [Cimex lectularius]